MPKRIPPFEDPRNGPREHFKLPTYEVELVRHEERNPDGPGTEVHYVFPEWLLNLKRDLGREILSGSHPNGRQDMAIFAFEPAKIWEDNPDGPGKEWRWKEPQAGKDNVVLVAAAPPPPPVATAVAAAGASSPVTGKGVQSAIDMKAAEAALKLKLGPGAAAAAAEAGALVSSPPGGQQNATKPAAGLAGAAGGAAVVVSSPANPHGGLAPKS